jgi:hypothetical protein
VFERVLDRLRARTEFACESGRTVRRRCHGDSVGRQCDGAIGSEPAGVRQSGSSSLKLQSAVARYSGGLPRAIRSGHPERASSLYHSGPSQPGLRL